MQRVNCADTVAETDVYSVPSPAWTSGPLLIYPVLAPHTRHCAIDVIQFYLQLFSLGHSSRALARNIMYGATFLGRRQYNTRVMFLS